MKTFRISFVIFTALFAAGFSTVFGQAVQVRPETWTGCLYVGCALNGAGDNICGTLEAHGVYRFNKEGVMTGAHFNHKKSEFTSVTTGEIFKVYGATNYKYNKLSDTSVEFNETLILSGDRGTKYIIKTRFFEIYNEANEIVDSKTEVYFERCID